MFELEIVSGGASSAPLPESDPPASWTAGIAALSILPWEEHCVECAMPACYRTCQLYEPRNDGKCRRFKHGFEFVRMPENGLTPIVRIEFKRWGALFSYGKRALFTPRTAARLEKTLRAAESFAKLGAVRSLSIGSRRAIVARLVRRSKQSLSSSSLFALRETVPTAFVAQVYAAEDAPDPMTITFAAKNRPTKRSQYLARLHKGWNNIRVDYSAFIEAYHCEDGFSIAIDPNLGDDTALTRVLYFATTAFVVEHAAAPVAHDDARLNANTAADSAEVTAALAGAEIKAAIWDLDNTLWEGVLTEDGQRSITAKPEIVQAIHQLDQRGIVQSVVSKNDLDYAKATLEALGLWDYFVYPHINWSPKSTNVQSIIGSLNIHPDTVLFVDDSPFERAEVKAMLPSVRSIDPADVPAALTHKNLNPSVSQEGASRRILYQAEAQRQAASGQFEDYEEFLATCNIELSIDALHEDDLDRAFELVTRTNQLNFSGTRYSREELAGLAAANDHRVYLLKCRDKFGDYGTVGIAVVEAGVPLRVTDFALSCRVQAKRVEHFFLKWLYEMAASVGSADLHVTYRPTPRNSAAGQVFTDLMATRCTEHEECYRLSAECFQCLPPNLICVASLAQ